ncbi:endonuclease NucS domain-containing protein [Clostridium sp.]|uniref:endonuclease NucS domain-containing protein n=1 Tax=Clostridium sp. TaxID=1506 RepID=UPI0028FE4B5A|nr:endonuclease NucS domain-containing protein [Clostridium sp.]MDU2108484.1 endonuclease NucS [Clostridium sp.]MDU3354100.1 endonuclease NucS [Clostridium sp.]
MQTDISNTTSQNFNAKSIEDVNLTLSFDLNTLDHLGVKLYYEIPSMLAELISNSWDADAHEITIRLNDLEDKSIIFSDDGEGMNFEELNDCYLKIGRNRRVETGESKTAEGRYILGKKGLGKLSVFGVGKVITVTSIKDNLLNSFEMNYEDIKNSNGTYNPKIIKYNEPTQLSKGTTICISEIQRKSPFDINSLAISLSSRFNVFCEDFKVNLIYNDSTTKSVTNSLYNDEITQFTWNIPSDFKDKLSDKEFNFLIENNINGSINTAEKPLITKKRGIILYSRGKLVQEPKAFNERANDHVFQYMFGSINVDFLDSDPSIDYTSTNRKYLVWDIDENNCLSELYDIISKMVSITSTDWKNKRKKCKEQDILDNFGTDVQSWVKELDEIEKPIASKLTNAILSNDNIDNQEALEYITGIQEMFDFKSFQNFAHKLDSLNMLGSENAIKLLNDWQLIESKEMAKIAIGRIKTIDQFEKYINENASETKVIQKFLEEFPWLLDSKMSKFEREVTFSNLLKRNYNDDFLPEKNRRIDFLCSNENGVIHIIELKRPNIKITIKEIQQITEYVEFINKQHPQSITKVIGYLISDNMNFEPGVPIMIKGLESQCIYVKSYSDLLKEARTYNSSFINAYNEIKEKKEH